MGVSFEKGQFKAERSGEGEVRGVVSHGGIDVVELGTDLDAGDGGDSGTRAHLDCLAFTIQQLLFPDGVAVEAEESGPKKNKTLSSRGWQRVYIVRV